MSDRNCLLCDGCGEIENKYSYEVSKCHKCKGTGRKKVKAVLKIVKGRDYLVVNIPSEYVGVHSIPVITKGSRKDNKNYVWTWNGNLEKPTVKPSLAITVKRGNNDKVKTFKIHLWLNDGVCKFLGDCNDGSANKELELAELPDWAIKESNND